MAKRGRPRYPDILTPREWEVLALLREGLSNDGIGGRLGITERTAKYHVSEILSKLGVTSRDEAAAWQPEERPRWLAAAAPVVFFWRKMSFGWLSPATTAVLGVVLVTGAGLLVWGLVRTGEDEIAVVSEPGVYLVRPDGSGLRRLPSAGRSLDGFAWAPSGNRFALAPACGAEHELLIGAADVDELEQVASLPGSGYLYWSPKEDVIAVASRGSDDGAGGVFLVDIASGEMTTVEGAQGFGGWSHDGRRLLIRSELMTTIVDAAAGQRTDLGDNVLATRWSPTDDRLSFSYTLGSPNGPQLPTGVDVVRGDGTGRTVIVPSETDASTATAHPGIWSPDGARLLVMAGNGSDGHEFLLYDVGAPEQPLSLGESFHLGGAGWLPNGLLVLKRDTPAGEVFLEIRAADGSLGTRVPFSVAPETFAFSPEGNQIALSLRRSEESGADDLYLTDVGSGPTTPRMLVSAGLDIFHATWSPDGSYVAFMTGPVIRTGCDDE